MKTVRHLVAGFVLFAVLVGLLINAYTGLEDNYDITRNDTKTLNITGSASSGNIVEHLRDLNLLEGIAELQVGIQRLSPSTGTQFDVLGGLASVGVGALKVISGIVTTPFEIVSIITTFYANETAGIMATSLMMIVVVYVGFILLSAYLGKDV